MSQGMPAISLTQLAVITPNKAGRFWGQKFATLFAFGGKSKMGEVPQKIQQAIDFWEKQKENPGAADTIRQMKLLKGQLQFAAENTDRIGRNVLQAFKLALEQPSHEEAVEFFRGFATGLSKKGLTSRGLARQTTATAIYSLMLAHWEEVDRLPTVSDLRAFLLRHGMSDRTLGDIERLQKLCSRIGYAPGKRGRTGKSKK